MAEKKIVLTNEEKIALKNDIHRVNHEDLKNEILEDIEKAFVIEVYFKAEFTEKLILNAYEFYSLLIKSNINYSNWFYKRGAKENKLLNLSGMSNVTKIIWKRS